MASSEAERIRRALNLQPHLEGGWYHQSFVSPIQVKHPLISGNPTHAASTAIYYLLEAGSFSAFHRIRSDEVWHWYAGGALELFVIHPDGWYEEFVLGTNWDKGQRPQIIVPASAWQAARPAAGADYVLCGCTVSPGFEFADFEMPSRATLMRNFPQYETLIKSLTREET